LLLFRQLVVEQTRSVLEHDTKNNSNWNILVFMTLSTENEGKHFLRKTSRDIF
jgi:hypothetical protein